MSEFLPLCDVLFNVISLAGYFCDVVFDVVMSYALLERGYKGTFAAAIFIVVTSLLITQILSLKWYLQLWANDPSRKSGQPWAPIALHCCQLGVLWRYARLFIPVDLRLVKHQVRDLCMLRLVHAFCEAAPMLLLQLHVYFAKREPNMEDDPIRDDIAANKAFEELNVISASLSLFSICWALASFSKNVRLQNVHRLVLTWLGVIFQFLWRLGTVSARVCALTVYALVYDYWVFLVIGLHWLSMYLWLISAKSAFHGERISRPRKACLSALIAFVYVFAYINLHEQNHRQKMITFYCVMLVENCVLLGAWAGVENGPGRPIMVVVMATAAYLAGLAFMLLYYRYFHVRRLGYLLGENQNGTNSTNASSQNKNGKKKPPADNASIPGVFNCRFTNPVNANARKKKKPTSFVPPPAATPSVAFWRRPLPSNHHHHGGSSENEGSSVGSRVNIQQKLQEKKQKQLAELRVIEEEIKQGKLSKTSSVPVEEIYSSLQRQPIPRAKTHIEPAWNPDTHPYQNYPVITQNFPVINQNFPVINQNYPALPYPTYSEIKYETNNQLLLRMNNLYPLYEKPGRNVNEQGRNGLNDMLRNDYSDGYQFKKLELKKRSRTPEILLAPHYLDNRPGCCHKKNVQYGSRKKEDAVGASSGDESHIQRDLPRAPSDIDSQISLPRSYTLPREFRYWRRRTRLRDNVVPSNNSSDGDVDSADENDSDRRSNGSTSPQNQNINYEAFAYQRDYEYASPDRRRRDYVYRKQTATPETKL